MAEETELKQALLNFIDKRIPDQPVVCTIDSVDLTKLTCYCIPVNGNAEIFGVRLIAQASTGLLIIPKKGSVVVVSFIDDGNAFISMFSQVDEIQLNGDAYGGLPKIVALTTKLNLLVSQVQAELTLIATGISAAGGAYTPGTLSNFNKTDYESAFAKHGDGT